MEIVSWRAVESFLAMTLGSANKGELCPQGAKLSQGVNILCLNLHISKQQRVFTHQSERKVEHSR
jgi:hypothetical protein